MNTTQKFGLVKKGSTAKARQNSKPHTIFSKNDESDDNDVNDLSVHAVNKRLADQTAQKKRAQQYCKVYEAALDEDPSVFEYDEVYDKIKNQTDDRLLRRSNTVNKESTARYIPNLQTSAEIRQRDHDRAYERKLQKERENEEKERGEASMEFITESYKKKLMENRKWDLEDSKASKIEEKTTIESLGMSGFFSSLLTKNVAIGGNIEKNSISAYTVGSKKNQKILGESEKTHEIVQVLNRDVNETLNNDEQVRDRNDQVFYEKEYNLEKDIKADISKQTTIKRPREQTEETLASTTLVKSVDQGTNDNQTQRSNEDKAEAIKSARERYLKRQKLKQES